MAATSLQELFVEELRDVYDAEKRLVRALPKMAKAAESGELQNAFTSHLKETDPQVTRLAQVFRSIGETPRGKKCDGMMGIVEEGNHAMEELEGPVLDAALIAGAQKVEHYEIATYGTLAYYAELLGHNRAKDLLGETLDEEKAADEKLSQLAKSDVNREALMGGNGEEMSDEDARGMRMMRRSGNGRSSSSGRTSGRGTQGGNGRRSSRSSSSRRRR